MSNVAIDVAQPEDFDEVFAFMQNHFRVNEPITAAIETTAADSRIFYKDLCESGFRVAETSLIARNPKNEIVGVALNTIYEYEELAEAGNGIVEIKREYSKDITDGPYPSRNANRLISLISQVERPLIRHIPLNSRVFKCDILGIRSDYYRKGIGTALLKRSLGIAKRMECSWAAACATAHTSYLMFQREGFTEVERIDFVDFLDEGVAVYTKVPDGGTAARLMVKRLST